MDFFATIRDNIMENKYTKEIWKNIVIISFCFLFFILAQFCLDKTPNSINFPIFLGSYLFGFLFISIIASFAISETVGDFIKISDSIKVRDSEDFQGKMLFLRMQLDPLLERKNIDEIILENTNEKEDVLNENWIIDASVVLGIAPTIIFSIIYGIGFFI